MYSLPIWHVSGTGAKLTWQNRKGTKASFGSLRRLPSGRWQAGYTGPDGLTYNAPVTFTSRPTAEEWLSTVRADLTRGKWRAEDSAEPLTFGT
jgi:hypothetical protein